MRPTPCLPPIRFKALINSTGPWALPLIFFGIPFTFLPIEGKKEEGPTDEKPKTFIQVLKDKKQYQILFPNILRVQREIEYFIEIDWKKTEKITLSSTKDPVWVQVAPTIERPDISLSQKMLSINEYFRTGL